MARVGHIRSFTAFAAVATISVILHGLLDSLPTWALLRAMTGFSLAGMYLVIESWLQEIATPGNRGSLFSLYMISNYLGMSGGQLMLNVGDPIGMELVLVIALLFALCLIPIALTRAVNPAQIELQKIEFLNFMRSAPFGSLGSFSSGMIIGAFLTLAPAWGVQHGLTTEHISAFMAVAIFGGLILQWPIGKLSDHYNRALVMIGLGIGMILLPLEFILNLGGTCRAFCWAP
ncbi:MAG: MFS transporter [Gammaproteobacteria bacterium]|nr:MFS transporter [Gammaproteobacteria bacterium]